MGIPLVVIVGADKGGVGKTTLSRILLDYFKAQGMDARAFDTEAPHGVLKRFHGDRTEIVDLTKPADQMKVFDTLATAPVTVVDVRAGLLSTMLQTLRDIGFLDMVREGRLKIVVLHVIGSTVASFSEIKATGEIIAGSKHFVVKNRTNDASFFDWNDDVAGDAQLASDGVIDIPKLVELATEHVEASALPFAEFSISNDQSLVLRGHVKHWMGKVYQAFDIAKLNAQ